MMSRLAVVCVVIFLSPASIFAEEPKYAGVTHLGPDDIFPPGQVVVTHKFGNMEDKFVTGSKYGIHFIHPYSGLATANIATDSDTAPEKIGARNGWIDTCRKDPMEDTVQCHVERWLEPSVNPVRLFLTDSRK